MRARNVVSIVERNQRGPQPYDAPVNRAARLLMEEVKPGDTMRQAVVMEHRGPDGDDLIPRWARERSEQHARDVYFTLSAIRLIITHDAACAAQMAATGNCRCAQPCTVTILRPERAP